MNANTSGSKSEFKLVLILTLIAALIRTGLYLLFSNETVFGPDQIRNVELAQKFATGDFYGVLDTYWAPLYPILVGVFSIFSSSPVLPSIALSILLGSLIVPATFILARPHYGYSAALTASILVVFSHNLLNSSVFVVGSENIYVLSMAGALIFGWKAINGNRLFSYVVTGIFLGLGYLTRPEAIGYFVVFLLFLSVRGLFARKNQKRSVKLILGFCVGFVLLAAPYLIYLRAETGGWTISGKYHKHLVINPYRPRIEAEEGMGKTPTLISKGDLKMLLKNLMRLKQRIPDLLPVPAFLFAIIGLFCVPWSRSRLSWEAYLGAFCVLTVMCYIVTYVQTRYFFILLPIFFGWMGAGIVQFHRWITEIVKLYKVGKLNFIFGKKILISLCLLFIFAYSLPANQFVYSEMAKEERDAGLWIKTNGKPYPIVFSGSPRPAFYAEGKAYSIESDDLNSTVEALKTANVDYVVTSELTHMRQPYLAGLFESMVKAEEFKLVYEDNRLKGHEVAIFQRK